MPSSHRVLVGMVLALALWSPALAQDDATPKSRSAAEEKLDAIMAELRADMEKARAEEMKRIEEWKKAATRAEEEGKPAPPLPAMSMGLPKELAAKYIARLEEEAVNHEGTDDAIPFLTGVVTLGSMAQAEESARKACKTLTTTHLTSPELASALPALGRATWLLGQEEVDGYLRTVESESPHAVVKARAVLARVAQQLERSPIDSPEYTEARREARRAAELAQDADFAREVQQAIDRREKLAVGTKAQDIVGVDLDGTPFKLSDYRGKIILLDFWGDW